MDSMTQSYMRSNTMKYVHVSLVAFISSSRSHRVQDHYPRVCTKQYAILHEVNIMMTIHHAPDMPLSIGKIEFGCKSLRDLTVYQCGPWITFQLLAKTHLSSIFTKGCTPKQQVFPHVTNGFQVFLQTRALRDISVRPTNLMRMTMRR